MFVLASTITSVIILVILLFVFWRNIKTINRTLPSIIDDGLNSLAAAAEYGRDLTYTNCAEARIELNQRAKAVAVAIEADGLVDIQALHNRLSHRQSS